MAKALLADMVIDLRAEAGHSLLLGQGTNMEDTLKYYLRRTQRELYTGFDWPQFMIYETVPVQAGDRFLTGLSNIDKEQVNDMWCSNGSGWTPMVFGITPAEYSATNSDAGQQGWPIRRYRYDDTQDAFELWPLPSMDTSIMAHGQTLLPPLIDDADQSLLDGHLIVMFAAANVLARQKDEDASLVLNKAQQYLNSLMKQNGSQKRSTRSMAAGYASGGRYPRPGLDFIPPGPRP